jgi:hypothetical protein
MALFNEKDYQGLTDYFQYDPNGKNILNNAGKDGAPDLSKIPRDLQFTIKCSAGLLYDTPVLLAGVTEESMGEPTITTMGMVFNVHANKNLPIFATANDAEGNPVVIESHMMGLPKELQTDQFVEFTLSNGYGLQAADGLQIMDSTGEFVPVVSLKEGDTVTIFEFNPEAANGVIRRNDIKVLKVNTKKSLVHPIYLFMSEHENMVLPYITQNDTVQSIPIKQ